MGVETLKQISDSDLFTSIDKKLAIIVFDLQGNVVRVNENFASAMEYATDEMIGLHHREFCLPEFTSSQEYISFWQQLRSGVTFQDKIERVTKSRRRLILEATYMPVFDSEHQLQGVLKVATDITDRESVLKESISDLTAMIEQMTASTDTVLRDSNRISDNMNRLQQAAVDVEQSINSINSVISFVESIAQETKILGFNASIESARTGEHGHGFRVIATEIRKMAETSRSAVQKIQEQITKISRTVDTMTSMTTQVAGQVNSNDVSINDLKQSYERIAFTTEKISSNI